METPRLLTDHARTETCLEVSRRSSGGGVDGSGVTIRGGVFYGKGLFPRFHLTVVDTIKSSQ